jgi:arsenate reductase
VSDFPVTIFHNPACGTSRRTLEIVRAAGYKPEVVEYLKTGWTRPQLERLLAAMSARPRDILRERGRPPRRWPCWDLRRATRPSWTP